MDFYQVDVFAQGPDSGNPLAVFVEPGDLSARQMQDIATEMNLSETTFVSSHDAGSYDVRIFTPAEELDFAGHPTVGTAWLLRHLEMVTADKIEQRTPAGTTIVRPADDVVWFERSGSADDDIEASRPQDLRSIAEGLGLTIGDIGLEARELGRNGRLRPAFADAGLRQLMVPLTDIGALGRVRPPHDLDVFENFGAYCFTAAGAGRVRARGLWPGTRIPEDPATGSAAAALGIYLANRLGKIEFEVEQGVEMGRPSRIFVSADQDEVQVGGRCHLVLKGKLESVPTSS